MVGATSTLPINPRTRIIEQKEKLGWLERGGVLIANGHTPYHACT